MQKGVGGFFSEVKAELAKVSWPKKEDVVKMSPEEQKRRVKEIAAISFS